MMDDRDQDTLGITSLHGRLDGERGPRYWRSLEELADTPEFREAVVNEFGPNGLPGEGEVSRRGFLSIMAASLALAGLTRCDKPAEPIVPYVRRPEEILPGKPLFFATAFELGGHATGILVKSHMGRPIKIEGNPEHPASLGACDAITQASILSLYDPDRAQVVRHLGQIATWDAFLTAMRTRIEARASDAGRGLRILSEPVVSPTLADQRRRLLEALPRAKWHQYTPVHRDAARAGAVRAFGRDVQMRYDLRRARVILSLDADFLARGPGHLRHARQFADGRRVSEQDETQMNRLYTAESAPTLTGAMSDHRFSMPPARIRSLAAALARRVTAGEDLPQAEGRLPDWFDAVVEDLQRNRGASLVVVGAHQPAEVHALGHVINEALGAVGGVFEYTDPVEAHSEDNGASLGALVSAMDAGEVDTLVTLGGNPVYDAPADLRFSARLEKVPLRVHVGPYADETARLAHWHVPQAHYLESWSDTRAMDGTVSVVQPLIAPLYGGKSLHEVLAVWLGEMGQSGESLVRTVHERAHGENGFDRHWNRTLHDGVMAGTRFAARTMQLRLDVEELIREVEANDSAGTGLDLLIREDPTIYDGRFANNGWLQELPKPLTKLTWDNAALISPSLAERHDLRNGDVVELTRGEASVRGPVWILPGQPADCVTVHLGHGRRRAGRVGSNVGFDIANLRTGAAPWGGPGLRVRKTGERREPACTQDHHSMEGREHVRAGSLQQFLEDPHIADAHGADTDHALSLYPKRDYDGYAWGMVINLNTCIGCNACVTACQAENNIPIVGADEVRNGREMHWIRVDRYFEGPADDPATMFQPVPCMHCEEAPCEVVCPVAATVHSKEGLNDMIYNRCVGTRYCSNNCPYKVRRFNFYEYADFDTPSLKLLHNPDVTVRSRGVMEKCTYCVQRINSARIEAKKQNRSIVDNEVVTACQAACPTEAIVFGDINDADSRVSKLKKQPHHYALLGELNTRPRTTYLAKLRNPNPNINLRRDHD